MKRFAVLLVLLMMLPLCAWATAPTYGLNETATCRDGMTVTITGVRESTGSSWNRPDSGKVFLIVEFLFVNNTRETKTVSSMLQFDAYEDDFALDFDFAALLACDDTVDVTIAAGKRAMGEMGWSVRRNWQTLEIHFKPSFWGSEELVFVVNRSDLTN